MAADPVDEVKVELADQDGEHMAPIPLIKLKSISPIKMENTWCRSR